jgi:hypothetical protein
MTCPALPSLVGKLSPEAVSAPVTSGAAVIVKLPLDSPVKLPVPTITLSALSSQPINTLSEEPLSITIPASVAGAPEVPVPSSIIASSIVVLLEEFVG